MVAALLDGPKRFNELQEELDGIAPNVLSSRLKALTEQALVVAQPYSERPPRFAYELSESGRELAARCGCWPTGARAPRRRALPSRGRAAPALEARWWCPSCGVVVDDPERRRRRVRVGGSPSSVPRKALTTDHRRPPERS